MIRITNIVTESNDKGTSVKLCSEDTIRKPALAETATSKVELWKVFGHDSSREMSVTEFANGAGISRQRVVKMIAEGRLEARKIGEQYVIQPEELVKYLQTK